MSKPRNNLIGHTIFLTSEKYRMLPVIGHAMFFTSEKSDIGFPAFRRGFPNQGGDRLGGETSGSERKCVMQWTGSELKSKRKLRVIWGFGGTERGIFYPCIVVVFNLKMFWSR